MDASKTGGTDAPQGQTLPQEHEQVPERVPRAPHERDESADSQAGGEPSGRRVGQAAHDDLAAGRQDTSKAAETDAAYENLRREAPPPRADGKPQ